MPATGVPPLSQVLAKGFHHSRPWLHPIPFRQCVKAQPSIQAPAVEAELFRYFGDREACGLHPVERLKQFEVFLTALPRHFRFPPLHTLRRSPELTHPCSPEMTQASCSNLR